MEDRDRVGEGELLFWLRPLLRELSLFRQPGHHFLVPAAHVFGVGIMVNDSNDGEQPIIS